MKHAACAAVVVIAGLFLASCASISYKIRNPEIPPDLDAYLREREGSVAGLIPGNEKRIAWAGEPGQKTPISLVYFSGVEGTNRDYEAVLSRVAETLGANVYYARLRGYGVTTEEIVSVSLDDWINDVWESWRIGARIGEKVVVVGSSMGADLALWLGLQKQPETAGLILLSCAVQPQDRRSDMLLWPWPLPNLILRMAAGKYNVQGINPVLYPSGNKELFARYVPPRYRSESTIKLMRVIKLVRTLPLEAMSIPTLWLYSEKDDVVDIPTLKSFYQRTGDSRKRLVEVPDAHAHMLAGDLFHPETSAEVAGFMVTFLREAGIS